MIKAHMDCTTCSNHQRLVVFNITDGVAEIEHICNYFDKALTAEEIKEPCDEYEEKWD